MPLSAGIVSVLGLLEYVDDGPIWDRLISQHIGFCRESWWTTLLYAANIISPGVLCFWHSWYLMVDMQFYFLSPLILYPLWRFKKRIAIMILFIFGIASASVVFIFVVFIVLKLRVSNLSTKKGLSEVLIYMTIFGHIAPWMMGILVGYIMNTIDGKSLKFRSVVIGWLTAGILMFLAVFGVYPLVQENFDENSFYLDATYESLKGIIWCLAMGWIILACHLSHGTAVPG